MVNRYNCYGWDIRRGEMRREDDGQYVHYSDYAVLEAENARLMNERNKAHEQLTDITSELTHQQSWYQDRGANNLCEALQLDRTHPPSPAVTEASVKLNAQKVFDECGLSSLVNKDQHDDVLRAIRAALQAAQEVEP